MNRFCYKLGRLKATRPPEVVLAKGRLLPFWLWSLELQSDLFELRTVSAFWQIGGGSLSNISHISLLIHCGAISYGMDKADMFDRLLGSGI